MRAMLVGFALAAILTLFACSSDPLPEQLLVRADAQRVERYAFPGGGRQISYSVKIAFPEPALSDDQLANLKAYGWVKCSGYEEGWDSFVDASAPGSEKTVFQRNSYWSKADMLLTVSMRYYAGVTKEKRKVKPPDNDDQHVVILLSGYPGIREKAGLRCPNSETVKAK